MNTQERTLFIGDTPYKPATGQVRGEYINLLGDTFYRIQNYDAMNPFFISVVSSSDHWLFISTTGGISAGRVTPSLRFFPITPPIRSRKTAKIRAIRLSFWSHVNRAQTCGSRSLTAIAMFIKSSATSTRMFPVRHLSLRKLITTCN